MVCEMELISNLVLILPLDLMTGCFLNPLDIPYQIIATGKEVTFGSKLLNCLFKL